MNALPHNVATQISASVDIPAMIDASPVSRFQWGIFVLLGAAMIMDGFDVQSMGFVAPEIIHVWGISKVALGPVFSASLLGMLLGSLILSVLADRVGRRPVLVGSMVFLGVCMFATVFATNLSQLLAARFVTGIGIGGIMGNAMALVSEYSPARNRVSTMMIVLCGFTGGAVLGGTVAAVLIPLGGWHTVFVFGALLSLIIGALMALAIPESLQFLILRGRHLERVSRWLARIAPHAIPAVEEVRYIVHEPPSKGTPIGELFRAGRSLATLLLWGINFANLLNLFFLANWLPTIISGAGYGAGTGIALGIMLQVGGVAGTVGMGFLIDRLGFYRVLVPALLVAAASIAIIGQTGMSLAWLVAAVTISGFCIVGVQPAINALAATIYPTSVRATGIGWSLGIGRAGSIFGPVVAGYFVSQGWSTSAIFRAASVPAVLSVGMVLCIYLFCDSTPSASLNNMGSH
ncbi:4-hydroxybenzoate transporter [Burkholderia diffusa]|uniref:4-hydroxybenzoate transporter n=1 Tax=Burkholderia diffusa TaxID=488732 RepID=A0AAW3P9Q4_9BURK|nr:MFS transporter [Burkholderia diffusa]KWF32736.1 4-hydroxybenzoate transporter [Burkholderia diffusa]KWF38662.1 4-hydroxybenzoate transporter [Burkholderia diffusa]KWF46707.1 4-hydroxybenzoate transporter [Burkholderia diffusa]KWF50721.1 4-hydroxybenzoate transporter [Burkholderia diffusa]